MSTTRIRLLTAVDRLLGVGLPALVVGTALAFGGAAWWAPAMIAGLTAFVVAAWLVRAGLAGRWEVLKSPWTGLGLLGLGLGLAQLVPMPDGIVRRVSPTAWSVHALGAIPDLVRVDDPDAIPGEAARGRTPLSLDRSATVRWLGVASACLALFWIASHFADRLSRLYLIWGSVVAAFLLNAAIALIQIVGQSDGMYGFIEPGKGPLWGPTVADALAAPGETALRPAGGPRPTPRAWVLPTPDRPHLVGTMMGGPGAHVALGSIGLPLALAVTLQLMAPRGARDGLWDRLRESGLGSLLVLLYLSTIAGAFLMGMLAGPRLVVPFAVGIALVGIPSLFGTGLRGRGLILTASALAALGAGDLLGAGGAAIHPSMAGLPRVDDSSAPAIWSDARAIARDFPWVGSGLGSFPAIQPYYKSRDAASTTAMSSVLQWWAESGAVGLALLGCAALWAMIRLPGALRRVGSADRALAFGLVGAAACFVGVSALHWTVELPAVALAASAVAGTANRWLAGGTDLFVERG